MNKELQESIQYFDNFVNKALSEVSEFEPIEVIKHYNRVKEELAKLLVSKE